MVHQGSCGIDWTWSTIILRQAVTFKQSSVGTVGSKCHSRNQTRQFSIVEFSLRRAAPGEVFCCCSLSVGQSLASCAFRVVVWVTVALLLDQCSLTILLWPPQFFICGKIPVNHQFLECSACLALKSPLFTILTLALNFNRSSWLCIHA